MTLSEQLHTVALSVHTGMNIEVHRQLDLAVAKNLGQRFYIKSDLDCTGSESVAQRVERYSSESRLFQYLCKMILHLAWFNRHSSTA